MTTALVIGLAAVVALLAVLVVGLLRSHADILRALHDLGVNLESDEAPAAAASPIAVSRHAPRRTAAGVAAPRGEQERFAPATDLAGELPRGGAAHVAVADVAHDTLLAFLSTGCGTCQGFWDELATGVTLPGRDTRLVIVTNGSDAESPAAVADLAPQDVVTVMSSAAWDDYRVPVSPYFVLVDGEQAQVIGEGAGASWRQVHALLSRAAADAGHVARAAAPERPSLARKGGQDRADWVDAQLTAAGIEPGDPSLHPPHHPSHEATS